MFLHTAEN